MQRVPLIVDPDANFLLSCSSHPLAKSLPPYTATLGAAAQLILSDPLKGILGVFINPTVVGPGAISVIRCAHQKRPGVPVYLIQDTTEAVYDEEQMHRLGIQKTLIKPLDYSEIAKLVLPAKVLFETTEFGATNKNSAEPIDQEMEMEDRDFVSIFAENYLSGSISMFDVYVRLRPGVYIKILKAGDSFTAERVLGYVRKGVKNLYVKQESQEQYVRYCDKIAGIVIQNSNTSDQIKISQTLNSGDQMLRFLSSQGINENNLMYAKSFLENVQGLVTQYHLEKHEFIESFIQSLENYDHGVGTCIMTSLLLKTMKLDYAGLQNSVGLASLFHDVGLLQMPQELHGENEALMTAEQKELFRTHPSVGGKLLQGLSGISETVVQIIEQHHMRKGANGFPARHSTVTQLQMAEVVGFSDEFVNQTSWLKQTSNQEPFRAFTSTLSSNFSGVLVTAYQKMFENRKPAF